MSSSSALPPEVRQLIAASVPSVGHLEVLLLCHGAPERAWTAEEVNVQLRTSVIWSKERLEHLKQTGFLELDGTNARAFRLVSDLQRRAELDALARVYRTHRVAVISAIYTHPEERIRELADAFRFTKRRQDG